MNIANLLSRAGRIFAEKPAIAVGVKPYYSYGVLAHRVATMAGRFYDRLQLQSGDRVAIVMQNCPQFIEVLYATWHAGLCAVPINAKLHPREIQYILEDAGAAACFVTSELNDAVKPLADFVPSLAYVMNVSSDDYHMLATGDPMVLQECASDDIAWLFYTSGTTGRPKGAMLSRCGCCQALPRIFNWA